MENDKIEQQKFVPTALHWIAAPLFMLGLWACIAGYQSPTKQYSDLHLISLPFLLGASPYIALAAIYLFSIVANFLGYVEFQLVVVLKKWWRNRNT